MENRNIKFWEKTLPKELILHTEEDGIIYKYVSFETGIKILQSNSLYYSTASKFNDPYDLSPNFLDFNLNKEEINILLQDWEMDEHIKIKATEYFYSNPEKLQEILINILKSHTEVKGITCFSRSYLKSLMWSHYADKHHGLCLGFSFQNEFEKYIQASISYENKITPVNYVRDSRLAIYKWLFTKSQIWSYEEEIRRVSNIGNGLIPFRKSELVEIYYGLRLSSEQIDQIKNLTREKLYKIKKESKFIMNEETFDLNEVFIYP